MQESRLKSLNRDILVFLSAALISGLYMLGRCALIRPMKTGWLVANILQMALRGLFLFRVFLKADVPGWKALIPFYSDYTLWQTFYGKEWFYLGCELLAQLMLLVPRNMLDGMNGKMGTAGLAVMMILLAAVFALIILLLVHTWRCYKAVASAFGKSRGFAFWCLIVLDLVGWGILAYDHSICGRKRAVSK